MTRWGCAATACRYPPWRCYQAAGSRLASGDDGDTVRLWDVARSGDATAVMEGHGGRVLALALSDGQRLAAGESVGFCLVMPVQLWRGTQALSRLPGAPPLPAAAGWTRWQWFAMAAWLRVAMMALYGW